MTCKDCTWANRIRTYVYLCIFHGLVLADKDACEKAEKK